MSAAEILIREGARIMAKDEKGKTPQGQNPTTQGLARPLSRISIISGGR